MQLYQNIFEYIIGPRFCQLPRALTRTLGTMHLIDKIEYLTNSNCQFVNLIFIVFTERSLNS